MSQPIFFKKTQLTYIASLFFLGLIILIVTEAWWPGIMLVVGLPLALRQYLANRVYDMYITLLVFVGAFVTVQFDIVWRIFLPVLFSIGAVYVLCYEFLKSEQ